MLFYSVLHNIIVNEICMYLNMDLFLKTTKAFVKFDWPIYLYLFYTIWNTITKLYTTKSIIII